MILSVATATLALLAARTPDAFLNPQFWAEDGVVFWQQQAEHGAFLALQIPYAGYLHAAPRITAYLASFMDPAYAPRIYATAAIVLTLWSGVTAATCVDDRRLGALLGVGLLLPPMANGEIFGNITNVQWLLAPTLALLLAAPPSINRALFALVAGLSGPFSIFLAPLAAVKAVRQRDIVAGLVVLAGCVQAHTVLTSTVTSLVDGQPNLAHLLIVSVSRSFSSRKVAMVLGIIVLAYSLLWPKYRWLRVSALALSAGVLAGTIHKFYHAPNVLDAEDWGPRYFYIPRVALVWCAITLIFKSDTKLTAAAVAFIALMIDPRPGEFRKFKFPDMQWAEKVRAGEDRITILPGGPWVVTVPPRR